MCCHGLDCVEFGAVKSVCKGGDRGGEAHEGACGKETLRSLSTLYRCANQGSLTRQCIFVSDSLCHTGDDQSGCRVTDEQTSERKPYLSLT